MALKTQAQLKKDAAAKRKEAAKYSGGADYKDSNGKSHHQNLLDQATKLEQQATDPATYAALVRDEAAKARKEASKYDSTQPKGSYDRQQYDKLIAQATKWEAQANKLAPVPVAPAAPTGHEGSALGGPGTATTGPSTTTAPAPPPDPVAQALASGDVKALQTALNGAGSKLVVDGKRGPKTNAALAAYQAGHPGVTFSEAPSSPGGTPGTTPSAGAPGGSLGGSAGGGGGGTVTAPATTPTPTTPVTDQQITDYARSHYQYLAGFLDDPEIGGIIRRAAQQGVTDPDVLRGMLYNTNFWQRTTESQRQWDATAKLDPATQQQKITDRANEVSTQAKQMGVNLDPTMAGKIATDSLRNGWTPQQLQQAIGHQFAYQKSQGGVSGQTGAALSTEQQMRQIAGDYLVPLSDQTLAQWEGQIVSGDVSIDNFRAYAQETAKSLFPSLASAIDSGVTVKQYTEPYRQLAAKELDVAPDSIDFMNPKYMRAVSQIDPKTGDRTAMNLADWTQYLRSLSEWKTTKGANDEASQFITQLGQTFGKVSA